MTFSVLEFNNFPRMNELFSNGQNDHNCATVPAVKGEEKDVPDSIVSFPDKSILEIFSPGASK